MKITTTEMECALAKYFGHRANLIVPNVSWGMDVHECDLLVCTQAGYLWEVEIKVSKADLKKDAEKRHGHRNHRIKHLWFALPSYLGNCIEHVPAHAGILTVEPATPDRDYAIVRKVRDAATNRSAAPIPDKARYMLARLGAMRIWGLKDKLVKVTSRE